VNVPNFKDKRLTSLVSYFQRNNDKLSKALFSLAIAAPADKMRAYNQLTQIVFELRSFAQQWGSRAFLEYLETTSKSTYRKLRAQANDPIDLGPLFQRWLQDYYQNIDKALSSIHSLGIRLIQGMPDELLTTDERSAINSALSVGARQSLSANALHRLASQSQVGVPGKDGRIYRFELSYYVAMVAQHTSAKLKSDVALAILRNEGSDLVRVSDNPSTIGDYCDAYTGRIFSISGNHPTYPHISLIPGGGMPTHPWCHHVFEPVHGEILPPIDQAYLLEPGEVNAKRIAKVWEASNPRPRSKRR
jgi:hypothetical protein